MSTLLFAPRLQTCRIPHSVAAQRAAFERCESADWQPPLDDADDLSDFDDTLGPLFNDDRWEVFLPDDEPYERRPEPGDFWIDAEDE
jgi:hypothetical protein